MENEPLVSNPSRPGQTLCRPGRPIAVLAFSREDRDPGPRSGFNSGCPGGALNAGSNGAWAGTSKAGAFARMKFKNPHRAKRLLGFLRNGQDDSFRLGFTALGPLLQPWPSICHPEASSPGTHRDDHQQLLGDAKLEREGGPRGRGLRAAPALPAAPSLLSLLARAEGLTRSPRWERRACALESASRENTRSSAQPGSRRAPRVLAWLRQPKLVCWVPRAAPPAWGGRGLQRLPRGRWGGRDDRPLEGRRRSHLRLSTASPPEHRGTLPRWPTDLPPPFSPPHGGAGAFPEPGASRFRPDGSLRAAARAHKTARAIFRRSQVPKKFSALSSAARGTGGQAPQAPG